MISERATYHVSVQVYPLENAEAIQLSTAEMCHIL